MKELAKFFSGWEAFHAVFHFYLFFSATHFEMFGLHLEPTTNLVGGMVGVVAAIALAAYGWIPWRADTRDQ